VVVSCTLRLANTLLKDEESARDNHVLARNLAKYSSTDRCSRHGQLSKFRSISAVERRVAARRSAANASSVAFSADVKSCRTQTCLVFFSRARISNQIASCLSANCDCGEVQRAVKEAREKPAAAGEVLTDSNGIRRRGRYDGGDSVPP